jgi:hypothetical protein
MISFCITILNRLPQLDNTLRINLDNNDPQYCEFILVDFNSTDGLKKYIQSNFKNELKSGYLKYYFTDKLNYWHASIAKNTSHMLATGKYVVNLDCDNYTGLYGGKKLLEIHEQNENSIIHQSDLIFGSGCNGRISLSKEQFINIGGYNESFYPTGYNDPDLINRAEKFGLKYISWSNPNYNKAIKNTKEENIKNCNNNFTWDEMNKINQLQSDFNIEHNEYVANRHKSYIGIYISS